GHRARHLPHSNDGCHEPGAAGLACESDSVSKPAGQARRVCADGGLDLRDSHVERRDDPPGRRDPNAAQMNAAVERDVMEYDVCIVGAGPSGLSCAIRLKQLKPDLNICILEKASAVGAHALSGAVMEPGPLDALLPEWRQSPPGICVPAKRDE